jgi:phosphatidylserine/phosphatidylglycerophosphate/cardiolipin synthase-like enzyme
MRAPRSSSLASVAFLGLAAACGLTACATDPAADEEDPIPDANPADFDSKADGVSSTAPAVLAFIDGAKTRLYIEVGTLADQTLLTHLVDAARRGVDVHTYVTVKAAAHPETVLAEGGLEAKGVDTVVDRTNRLPKFLAIADDAQLTKTGTTYKTVTTPATVAKAASAFLAVTAEASGGAVAALPAEGTLLLPMPESTAAPIVALLDAATLSIDLEIYQLQSPAVIHALEAAAGRGVSVRVMLEPKTVGAINYGPVAARLARAGISVQPTPPAFDAHHNVDHAKFMVLDGAELVFGSGNLVRSGLGGNPAPEFDNRDFWIRDRRATSVAEATALFAADWARTATTTTTFTNLVLTPDNADARLLATIDGAAHRLYVYNQSLKDDTLTQHLVDAKARGVDVHVLLGDQPGFGGKPAANQPALDTLTAAGVPARFFTAHYLHGKVIVADDHAFVGSQNFTSGGLLVNRELGEVLADPTIVDALARLFSTDELHPTP